MEMEGVGVIYRGPVIHCGAFIGDSRCGIQMGITKRVRQWAFGSLMELACPNDHTLWTDVRNLDIELKPAPSAAPFVKVESIDG